MGAGLILLLFALAERGWIRGLVGILGFSMLYLALFRLYHEIKWGKYSYLVLLPLTAPKSSVLHELVHIDLGHFGRPGVPEKAARLTPMGPLVAAIKGRHKEREAIEKTNELLRKRVRPFFRLPGSAFLMVSVLSGVALILWL